MKKTKTTIPAKDDSTEERIKNAARIIFHQKGFAGARTRDIAEEAGINLALLNYYFRSKQKLFDLIMFETFHGFIQSVVSVFNDRETTLVEKVEILSDRYIEMLIQQPDIPLFVLSEFRANPERFAETMNFKKMAAESYFMVQFQEAILARGTMKFNPIHLLMNLVSMIIFPFIGRPILQHVGGLSQEQFKQLMEERKKLVPVWIKSIVESA